MLTARYACACRAHGASNGARLVDDNSEMACRATAVDGLKITVVIVEESQADHHGEMAISPCLMKE